MIISHPGKLSTRGEELLRASLGKFRDGGHPLFLDEGMTVEFIDIDPVGVLESTEQPQIERMKANINGIGYLSIAAGAVSLLALAVSLFR